MPKAKAALPWATPLPSPEREEPAKKELPPHLAYREGKAAFSTWMNEKAIRQMKALAAEEGKTIQELTAEMWNREFARHGKPEIA